MERTIQSLPPSSRVFGVSPFSESRKFLMAAPNPDPMPGSLDAPKIIITIARSKISFGMLIMCPLRQIVRAAGSAAYAPHGHLSLPVIHCAVESGPRLPLAHERVLYRG